MYHAYRSDGWRTDIWVMSTNGSNKSQLTTDIPKAGVPSYSRDGTRIAFVNWVGEQHMDLLVMNAAGSNAHSIITEGSNGDPRWSPDGSKIVFTP